jgi:uncharacterized membrane protein
VVDPFVIEEEKNGNPPGVTTPPNEPSTVAPANIETNEHAETVSSLSDVVRPDGPRPVAHALASVEEISAVDGPAGKLAELLNGTIPSAALDVLRGRWLGHPLHPVMVTVPIGAWMAVPILDVTGQRIAAQRLVAFGIAAALPASITGLAEYTTLDTTQRRVAVVHMAANTVSLGCLARSWWHRHDGFALRGAGWSLAGLAISGVAGALGGHLSYSQSAGVLRER